MKGGERSGLIFALAGFATLSIGDAVVKSMAGQWAPTAIAATRYALGMVWLGLLLGRNEGHPGFSLPLPAVQLLRGGGVALATVGYFSAVFVMPLATATAITFFSPMITALLAAVVLGEPARRSTLVAALIAFAGVLVVLRPNFAALGWAAALPLASAVGMSLLMIGNRLVAGRASSLAMQFTIAAVATPILIAATFAGHVSGIARFAVHAPSVGVLLRCLFVSVSASVAHWLIYMGTTRAGAASIAPMTYVQLLLATLFGWAFFGDHPDLVTLAGASVIIASGLYLWWAGKAPAQPEVTQDG